MALDSPYESVMAGLSCGKISTISSPILKDGLDAFLLVSDQPALTAMHTLSKEGIESGESGAASFAGLNQLFSMKGKELRERFQINKLTNILIFSTEGATDPEMYTAVMNSKDVGNLL